MYSVLGGHYGVRSMRFYVSDFMTKSRHHSNFGNGALEKYNTPVERAMITNLPKKLQSDQRSRPKQSTASSGIFG